MEEIDIEICLKKINKKWKNMKKNQNTRSILRYDIV